MIIRSSKLHEQVASELAREIISQRLPTGSNIPSEPELIVQYGISKTVARETVQALRAVGLVRIQHGKRTIVLPEEEWNILSSLVQEAYRAEDLAGPLIEELYEVRFLLEPQAARWAAERASSEEFGNIRRIIEAMKDAASRNASDDFLEYDQEFHIAISRFASNRVLRAVLRDVHELLITSWMLTELSPVELQTAFDQHERIAEALVGSDGAGAEQAMRAHLEWAAEKDRFIPPPLSAYAGHSGGTRESSNRRKIRRPVAS